MAQSDNTTMSVETKTHQKLKALAAIRGEHIRCTLEDLVDSGLKERGIDPGAIGAGDGNRG